MTPDREPTTPPDAVEHRLRVRYAETDRMGVVYYANYLVWFEVARAEFCRQRGCRYADIERDTGSILVVTEARCRYRRPARYDDAIRLRCWVRDLRSRRLTFVYEILDDASGALLAEGETVHHVVDPEGRPKSLPRHLVERLAGR
ncbi:MAG: thioesterase family protein [Candidatus Eiseniibacteriota bacterium]|jgi:acyl-CoA thioester hydrolase